MKLPVCAYHRFAKITISFHIECTIKPSILEIKSKVATDFDVVSVNIDVLVGVVEDRPRARVSRVARHVVGHHQNDLYKAWLKLQNDIAKIQTIKTQIFCENAIGIQV